MRWSGMIKPHWEFLYDCWIEDFKFELEQIQSLMLMLRKHPDDEMGVMFREMIGVCKKRLSRMVSTYEKIYGGKPNLKAMREEVKNA